MGSKSSESTKLLAFKDKAPAPKESHVNQQKVLYSFSAASSSSLPKKSVRHISQQPAKILDAPNLLDDYYLNLIDWSSDNQLAVALGSSIYLWNAAAGSINELVKGDESNGPYTSLQWTADSHHLGKKPSSMIIDRRIE